MSEPKEALFAGPSFVDISDPDGKHIQAYRQWACFNIFTGNRRGPKRDKRRGFHRPIWSDTSHFEANLTGWCVFSDLEENIRAGNTP